jgi:hypothetical protein
MRIERIPLHSPQKLTKAYLSKVLNFRLDGQRRVFECHGSFENLKIRKRMYKDGIKITAPTALDHRTAFKTLSGAAAEPIEISGGTK